MTPEPKNADRRPPYCEPLPFESMRLTTTHVGQILTRTCGYLATVTSHSLQPYRGCALGNSLCGVGCYVQHSYWVTRGERWGSFVDVRTNAPQAYRRQYDREKRYAHRHRDKFGIFLSSSTEPFQPAEMKHRVTRSVLEAMVDRPPDLLILQTHSHHVADYLDLYPTLAAKCEVRFHISIETDRDRLPGLPPPASSVEKRLTAAATLRAAGLRTVVTVSPLLPIECPERFFARLAEVADAVVIDHFIGGDGTPTGSRTSRTSLPVVMSAMNPRATSLAYRDEVVALAKTILPGRVGVGVDGFAGRLIP